MDFRLTFSHDVRISYKTVKVEQPPACSLQMRQGTRIEDTAWISTSATPTDEEIDTGYKLHAVFSTSSTEV